MGKGQCSGSREESGSTMHAQDWKMTASSNAGASIAICVKPAVRRFEDAHARGEDNQIRRPRAASSLLAGRRKDTYLTRGPPRRRPEPSRPAESLRASGPRPRREAICTALALARSGGDQVCRRGDGHDMKRGGAGRATWRASSASGARTSARAPGLAP